MKILSLFFVVLLSVALPAQSAENLKSAPQNFEKALKSGNAGLVESAIFHSLKFMLFYPEQGVARLKKQISRLVKEGETRNIRYKAYLAAQFLNHLDLLARIEKADYKDADRFFTMLGDTLQESVLVAK